MRRAVPSDVLGRLKAVAGTGGFIDDPQAIEAYVTDERDLYHGATPLVLRPDTTAKVAAIVRICNAAGVGVVPQGGNTGYCGGSVPSDSGGEIVLSLARLNRIRNLDAANHAITVESGCILADVQKAADDAGLLFPLSLGAEGSCQIGGNLSTNAGGVQVLRYGNARDLVLGLEVVLPDGRVWGGLRGLRKDNTGYDLKQLFLGAEGTLGVITAAVLKLYPKPKQVCTAMVALRDAAAATALLARLRAATGDAVSSFEYLNRACLDLVVEHIDGARDPFAKPHGDYAVVEIAGGIGTTGIAEAALNDAVEAGEARDAVMATSVGQAGELWRLRELIPEAQKRAGGSIKHDVSVPLSRIPELLKRGAVAALAVIPGARIVAFGHIGDGNIHFNLSPPPAKSQGGNIKAFLAKAEAVERPVHDLAVEL
ncbi:MAG: FAD-binding oxidoreductase, partial [Rhodospirillales bacterium]|nr:FAD-binding oxidoreductase [Rhodospirillales bacterium]